MAQNFLQPIDTHSTLNAVDRKAVPQMMRMQFAPAGNSRVADFSYADFPCQLRQNLINPLPCDWKE